MFAQYLSKKVLKSVKFVKVVQLVTFLETRYSRPVITSVIVYNLDEIGTERGIWAPYSYRLVSFH